MSSSDKKKKKVKLYLSPRTAGRLKVAVSVETFKRAKIGEEIDRSSLVEEILKKWFVLNRY